MAGQPFLVWSQPPNLVSSHCVGGTLSTVNITCSLLPRAFLKYSSWSVQKVPTYPYIPWGFSATFLVPPARISYSPFTDTVWEPWDITYYFIVWWCLSACLPQHAVMTWEQRTRLSWCLHSPVKVRNIYWMHTGYQCFTFICWFCKLHEGRDPIFLMRKLMWCTHINGMTILMCFFKLLELFKVA